MMKVMTAIERIVYSGSLPESFFSVPTGLYAGLPFRPEEVEADTEALFRYESRRNEVILYTDHRRVRLVGIFPADSNKAYFGFWETADDLTLNREAFALLEADAQARGRATLLGPLNFNTFHPYRLRLGPVPSWGRFDREPVNPVYYPDLLDALGFRPQTFFESRRVQQEHIPAVYANKNRFLEELQKIPFTSLPLTPAVWVQREEELYALVDEIFGANPGYKPIPREQFQLLYNPAFARKLCPISSVLFQDTASGRLAAMSFCHPHYKWRAKPASQPPAFTRDYAHLAKKVLLVKTVGVHPDFRRQGLMTFLGAYAMLRFRELYDEVIFCLMRSDNFSLHFSDGLSYESAKYALFEKSLNKAVITSSATPK